MKSPFKKENHTTLIVAAALVSVTAGVLTYLFMTDSGKNARKGLKKKIKSIAKDAAADAVSKHTKVSKKAAKVVADHVIK
jgi:hypothetical protein